MNASTFTASTPEAGGFVRAVFGRLTWRFALLALLTGTGLWLVSSTNWLSDYSYPLLNWFSQFITIVLLTASMTIALLMADEAVARGVSRVSAYVAAVVTGALVGAISQFAVLTATGLPIWGRGRRWEIAYTEPAYIFLQTLMFGGLAVFIYVNLRSSIAAARARNDSEVARVQMRRRTFESQLQAMQARVEPQFLFNTLAHVRSLYRRDAEQAGRMLDDLITYLRAALPHLRESSSVLGTEVELARAYLNIIQVRLGDRLSFAFDSAEDHAGARVPPMLLLPLIDCALARHPGAAGNAEMEPGPAPATFTIASRVADGRLKVTVAHSGNGFAAGDMAQLSSIGERIDSLYGNAGSFAIERVPQAGTCAIFEVPHEVADDHHR